MVFKWIYGKIYHLFVISNTACPKHAGYWED